MRVRVKENALHGANEDAPRHRLTELSEYFVLGIYNDELRLMNDRGEPIMYPKTLFDVCDSTIPPGWRFREGDDRDYYIEPRRLENPGFYEDLFGSDGNRSAQTDARRALREELDAMLAWGDEADKVVLRRDLQRMDAR